MVCHGIPSRDQVLKEGDIINVDVTVTLDGWFGDTSKTSMPGASDAVRALVQRTQECLYLGIRAISDPSAYRRLNQIGAAIHDHADRFGYGVVRTCGAWHRRRLSLRAQRSPLPDRQRGPALKPGHVFTIEPMINRDPPCWMMAGPPSPATASPPRSLSTRWSLPTKASRCSRRARKRLILPWLNAEALALAQSA